MQKISFRNAILCEHLAEETQKKHTLCGVFSGNILVASYPSQLRLAIYLEHIPATNETYSSTLEVRVNGVQFLKGEARFNTVIAGEPMGAALPNFILDVHEKTILEVFCAVDGAAESRVLEKRISLQSEAPELAALAAAVSR